jgi:hypothetical protein
VRLRELLDLGEASFRRWKRELDRVGEVPTPMDIAMWRRYRQVRRELDALKIPAATRD